MSAASQVKRNRHVATFGCLIILLAIAIWITPHMGAIQHQPDHVSTVMHKIRLPRLHTAMMAGAGLALAGMTFQALFRNPLATPFTLGVSSGASLAIAIGMALGLQSGWLAGIGQTAVAFCGALVAVLMVYAVAQLRSESSTSTLLLAGVSINFICGAGIILVQYFLKEHELSAVIYWLIGSVESVGLGATQVVMAILLLLGVVVLICLHRELDLLMMGDHLAASRGVDVNRVRALAYFCASLMTATVVAVCGPIAFVGLLVPHTMRTLLGPNHRALLPACLLFGMALLPICDCIARNFLSWTTPDNTMELPVGVVTNVLGGVFFLVVLIRQRSDRPILA